METETYSRKTFYVKVIQITEENMGEVAEWCKGTVIRVEGQRPYIEVEVHNPQNDRQKQGFIGDWVLSSEKGFKVYTDKAFKAGFDLVPTIGGAGGGGTSIHLTNNVM